MTETHLFHAKRMRRLLAAVVLAMLGFSSSSSSDVISRSLKIYSASSLVMLSNKSKPSESSSLLAPAVIYAVVEGVRLAEDANGALKEEN